MSVEPMEIIVIGGGAAGFFGAIACRETHPHTHVTLLEAGKTPLAKVRISGGGRCNVTHACFDAVQFVRNYPRGGKALRGAFSRFQAKDTVDWFTRRGVRLKTEADGRMFPITDDSETIVNCLMNAAKTAGVNLRTRAAAAAVEKGDNGFEVSLRTGEVLRCDRLLFATGSSPAGYRWATDLGHKIIPPVPSLFTFNIADKPLRELAGVSVETVNLQLPGAKLSQTEPLLITHWGISGPAVLKLSAWGARFLQECRYQTPLIVDWLPSLNMEQLRDLLSETKGKFPKRSLFSHSPINLPRRLWQYLILRLEIDEKKRWAELSKKELNRLMEELKRGRYQINGKGVFKEEFVTCGGVSLKDVDFKTMESRRCPGLYFAGEILDIDGVTGGFNFQNAWTTGWLAGKGMGNMFEN
ncbi:MAG: NAD(P)/FAD-dependent oxidoreductase [Limnospira sp.]